MAEKKKISAVVGRLKGETTTTVQTIIFSPKSAWTAEECKEWLKEHDFKADGMDETDSSFRFRQRDPGDFKESSFRTISFKGGKKKKVREALGLAKRVGTKKSGLTSDAYAPFDCGHCRMHEDAPAGALPEGYDFRCSSALVALDDEVPEDSLGNKVVKTRECCEDFEPKVEGAAAKAARGGENTMEFRKFIPFAKVDAAKREVWGIVTAEVPDKDDEVCDYAKSKPFYQAVIDEMQKATDGKNLFPLRYMHQLEAVGKGIGFEFRDGEKEIFMGFKVVDDDAWKKVDEGVLTGFSQGGSIVGDKLPDPVFKGCLRYTANPSEVSLVDNPCLGVAHFTYVKADGAIELRKFKRVEESVTIPVARLSGMIEEAVQKATGKAPKKTSPAIKTKRVAGEDLKAEAFLIAADPQKPETWHFPVKFASPEKTEMFVRQAIVKFRRDVRSIAVSKGEQGQAWLRLISTAQGLDIDAAEEQARASAIQAHLRKRARAAVNKHARLKGDPGHTLSFLDDNLGKLAKGLYDAGRLACFIEDLGFMLYGIIAEEQWEKDTDSPLPGMLESNVSDLLDTLVALVAEESQELRDDISDRMAV